MAKYLTLCIVLLVAACGRPPSPHPPVEFEEVRIHRWIALEGGEVFIMRRIGPEWSAELMGDGTRIPCFYHKSVRPKSDWNALWNTLIVEGLMKLSGAEPSLDIEDGDGFTVEIRSGNETRRYSVDQPTRRSSESAKSILRIGNLISRELGTPVFAEVPDRGGVFEHLYSPCRKQ